jgi:hypothetical protein
LRFYKSINITKLWYYNIRPSIIEVVSYTSIICMIRLYGTMHYDQPKSIIYNRQLGSSMSLIYLSSPGINLQTNINSLVFFRYLCEYRSNKQSTMTTIIRFYDGNFGGLPTQNSKWNRSCDEFKWHPRPYYHQNHYIRDVSWGSVHRDCSIRNNKGYM